MRLFGKNVNIPPQETVVIPRQDGVVVFRAAQVTNFEDFDKLCPRPKIPTRLLPGGEVQENVDDPEFKKADNQYFANKMHYTVFRSLQIGMPELEFDTINLSDPSTYGNYEKEFEAAGFTKNEIFQIIQITFDANGLNNAKIQAATKSFLNGREDQPKQLFFPDSEQKDTPTGGPASASE